jgi:hypothetical protein
MPVPVDVIRFVFWMDRLIKEENCPQKAYGREASLPNSK